MAKALELTPDERIELLAAIGDQPREQRKPRAPLDDRLADAASQLAYELRTRLRREEEQRQIHDPVPLPVRWHRCRPR